MRKLVELLASKIGVQPAYKKALENHGMCFFIWPESDLVAGQCQKCHNLLWVNARRDPILNEPKPSSVPECGAGYTAYYNEKITRFLNSLPPCPKCGCRCYDKFINNASFPRLEDGKELTEVEETYESIDVDANLVKVWLYD